MGSGAIRIDTAWIALGGGIEPVVVDVAVKHLVPMPRPRKPKAIAIIVERALVQARHDHDVPAGAGQPSMEGDHAIAIVHMEDVGGLAAQGWMSSTQPDQIASESMMISHVPIRPFEAGPPEEKVCAVWVVRPIFVFKEFLAHEEHRDAGSRHEQSGRDPRPAAGVPRT